MKQFVIFAFILLLLQSSFTLDCEHIHDNEEQEVNLEYNIQEIQYLAQGGYNGAEGYETRDDPLGFAKNFVDRPPADLINTEFTVSILLKVESSANQVGKALYHFKNAASEEEFAVSVAASSKLNIKLKTANVDFSYDTTTATLNDDWQFISIVVSFSTIRVFIDGTFQEELGGADDFQGLFTTVFDLYSIGGYFEATTNNPINFITSIVTHFKAFKTVLTDEEVDVCLHQQEILTLPGELECDKDDEDEVEIDYELNTVTAQEGQGYNMRYGYVFDGQDTSHATANDQIDLGGKGVSVYLSINIPDVGPQNSASIFYLATDDSASPNEYLSIQHGSSSKRIDIIYKTGGNTEQTFSSTNEELIYDSWQFILVSFYEGRIYLFINGSLVDQFFHTQGNFTGILGYQSIGRFQQETPLQFTLSDISVKRRDAAYNEYQCFLQDQNDNCYDIQDDQRGIDFDYQDVEGQEGQGYDGSLGYYFGELEIAHLVKRQNEGESVNFVNMNLTVTLFVKVQDKTQVGQNFFYASVTIEDQSEQLIIKQADDSQGIVVIYKTSAGTHTITSTNTSLLENDQWTHIGVIMNLNNIVLYIDGVQDKDETHTVGHFTQNFDHVSVGAYYNTSGDILNKFQGHISQLYFFGIHKNSVQMDCLANGYEEHEDEDHECGEDEIRLEHGCYKQECFAQVLDLQNLSNSLEPVDESFSSSEEIVITNSFQLDHECFWDRLYNQESDSEVHLESDLLHASFHYSQENHSQYLGEDQAGENHLYEAHYVYEIFLDGQVQYSKQFKLNFSVSKVQDVISGYSSEFTVDSIFDGTDEQHYDVQIDGILDIYSDSNFSEQQQSYGIGESLFVNFSLQNTPFSEGYSLTFIKAGFLFDGNYIDVTPISTTYSPEGDMLLEIETFIAHENLLLVIYANLVEDNVRRVLNNGKVMKTTLEISVVDDSNQNVEKELGMPEEKEESSNGAFVIVIVSLAVVLVMVLVFSAVIYKKLKQKNQVVSESQVQEQQQQLGQEQLKLQKAGNFKINNIDDLKSQEILQDDQEIKIQQVSRKQSLVVPQQKPINVFQVNNVQQEDVHEVKTQDMEQQQERKSVNIFEEDDEQQQDLQEINTQDQKSKILFDDEDLQSQQQQELKTQDQQELQMIESVKEQQVDGEEQIESIFRLQNGSEVVTPDSI